MLKMIIADDEGRVLQLIKKLVQWDELGIENVGEADNGIAAFDLIISKKPDIVITDIRMPGMNGLELVQKTREKGLNISFILVSGHKQFEYAQNALRFGVIEYLVKPINKQELNEILLKICNQQLAKNQRIEEDQQIKSQLERSREKLHYQFMRTLIQEPERLDLSDTNSINNDYYLNFTGSKYLAFELKVDRKFKEIDENELNIAAERIPQIINRNLAKKCCELVTYLNNSRVICVANFENLEAVNSSIKSIFIETRRQLEKHDYLTLTIGLGSPGEELLSIVNSGRAAHDAIFARMRLGTDRIIEGTTLNYKKISIQNIINSEREDQFYRAIESLDQSAVENWIKKIFIELSGIPDLHPKIFIFISQHISYLFMQTANKLGLESETYGNEKITSQIIDATSMAELENLLLEFTGYKMDAYLQSKRAQDAKPIRKAKQYMHEHYNESITLEQVAQEIHFNPSYFSVVFKKETGINFSDYLIKYRIEKAKDLLKNSFETNIEIAEKVGYKDAKYFAKLFTKVVGITPGDYRKLYE